MNITIELLREDIDTISIIGEDYYWAFLSWVRGLSKISASTFYEISLVAKTEDWNIIWFASYSYSWLNRTACLESLYIKPEYRIGWLGTTFLLKAELFYKELNTIWIFADCYEEWSLGFYKKNWFEEIWYSEKSAFYDKEWKKLIHFYKPL